MTQILGADLALLRSSMSGPALGPDDPGYDAARALWNGDIDRSPAGIARAHSAGDVAAAIAFAGGHAFSGPRCATAV